MLYNCLHMQIYTLKKLKVLHDAIEEAFFV